MGRELAILGQALIGRGQLQEIKQISKSLFSSIRQSEEQEILPAWYFEEKLGRQKRDIIGDDDLEFMDLDAGADDDDDEDVGIDDIIGALQAGYLGKRLTRAQRKALRKAHKAAKKEMRISNDQLALDLRQANRPIVRTDQENIMRKLNMPLDTITVAAGGINTFRIVVQESMRLERMFLYPVGGSYDNLWVGDIFCGRQTNSVVPGNEEPMINYSATAVDSGIEGFTVNYGLTLRILIRNGTGAPVVVGGKIKGRTLTS